MQKIEFKSDQKTKVPSLNVKEEEEGEKDEEEQDEEEEGGKEEEKVDSLHMVFLKLYPELIAYPCLFYALLHQTELVCSIINKNF